MDSQEEKKLIMIGARWEAICDILDGKDVSDFMLSFPEVRQVAELYNLSQKGVLKDEHPL